MDSISRVIYEQSFRIAFLERRGEAFQDLFSIMMEKRYPRGDFLRVRPWGKDGDGKNDGYLSSKRMLFQCYAPNELKATDCITKIDKDFAGALPHWKQYFETWVFVHNGMNGLSPRVASKILELRAKHAPIMLESWGYSDLDLIRSELAEADLAAIFGAAPSQRDVLDLGLKDLVPILDHLALLPVPPDPDLRPVPPDKLARNLLSNDVAALIKVGMSRADLVPLYFRDRQPKQDEIARGFNQKYKTLRDDGVSPDDIFTALQRYAGGEAQGSAKRQVAVFTVLAFFFQQCDIFERPDSQESPP